MPAFNDNNMPFVFVYFDPEVDCMVCYSILREFSVLQKTYPEKKFAGIYRNKKGDFNYFLLIMENDNLDIDFFWDKEGLIQSKFNLSDNPYFLAFSSEGKLVVAQSLNDSLKLSKKKVLKILNEI
ncbi:MAG: hypothetical protein CR997_08200 [Acidobacteria bacterium]|nr:MAG: hypothetical protein CR997_08200 [Acidobacteriota bacterium]